MNLALRKEFRTVSLPLAIACFAAFICGIYYVNDRGYLGSISTPIAWPWRFAAQFAPGILCISAAILAAVGFGSEYQQRTLPLLLAQPIGRSRIWNQKTV